jgi:hypothetical protein
MKKLFSLNEQGTFIGNYNIITLYFLREKI